MDFTRIGRVAVPALLMLALAACLENEDTQASGGSEAATATTVSTTSTAPATGMDIRVHFQWPSAAEVVDVEPAADVLTDNYVLVLDTSGSMDWSCSGEDKIVTARKAGRNFVAQIPATANVGLVEFGGAEEDQRLRPSPGTRIIVPLGASMHDEVDAALAGIKTGEYGTPMANGIVAGYRELLRLASAQRGYGTYNLVILGDGRPEANVLQEVLGEPERNLSRNPVDAATWNLDHIVWNTPISVTTIGFCTELREVMDRPGVSYYTANNLDELSAAFQAVLAEAEVFEDQGF